MYEHQKLGLSELLDLAGDADTIWKAHDRHLKLFFQQKDRFTVKKSITWPRPFLVSDSLNQSDASAPSPVQSSCISSVLNLLWTAGYGFPTAIKLKHRSRKGILATPFRRQLFVHRYMNRATPCGLAHSVGVWSFIRASLLVPWGLLKE